jgi:membrane protease YdiL (CAAX protease family)
VDTNPHCTESEPRPSWWAPIAAYLVISLLQAALFLALTSVDLLMGSETITAEPTSKLYALYAVVKNGVVLVVLLLALRVGRAPVRSILQVRAVDVRTCVVAVIMLVALIPWEIYVSDFLSNGGADESRLLIAPTATVMVRWGSLVLLTPVAEELLFRGYALSIFGRKSATVGIIASSGLFAIYHFTGSVESMLVVVPFGVVMACSVIATRSVFPAMIAHSLWNLAVVAEELTGLAIRPTPTVLVVSLLVCAGCAALLAQILGTAKRVRG